MSSVMSGGGLLDFGAMIDTEKTGWCILRTSGGKTLPLAESLAAAGIEAWTPRRTFKRTKPGRCEMIDGRKPTTEVDAPILPTFVFARANRLLELVAIAADPVSRHPDFHVMRDAGRYAQVANRSVAGLREAEAEAEAVIQAQREAETREERRRIRAAAANSERERRKLLRAEYRRFVEGTAVSVKDAPAFAGMSGIVKSSDGRRAVIAFGGLLTMEVEAWQVVPNALQGAVVEAVE